MALNILTPVGQVYGGKFQYLERWEHHIVKMIETETSKETNVQFFSENSMRKWLIEDKIKNTIGKEQKQFMEIEHNLLQSTIKLYHV